MEIFDYITQFVAAGVGTWGFSFVFNTPKKERIFCGINGAIVWLSYLLFIGLGSGITIACMGATFTITIVARIFSSIRKNPVTVFLITAIFPIVPGAGIYYTAYYLIMDNYVMAGAKGLETFKVAGGIVLGIVFGFMIPQTIFSKLAKYSRRDEDARYPKMQ